MPHSRLSPWSMGSLIVDKLRVKSSGFFIRRGALKSANILAPRISARRIRHSFDLYSRASLDEARSLVRGRRVALIGPGPVGTHARDLQSYDLIARLGYTGPQSAPPGTAARCDLNFLAKWHASKITAAPDIQTILYAQEMALICREDVQPQDFENLAENLPAIRFEVGPCGFVFREVVPNLAPQAILWLLSGHPKELHISHIDLMTSPKRPKGYASNKNTIQGGATWEYPRETMVRSFAQFHNPFTHYSFFKRIVRLPNVSVAPQLKEIMANGGMQYLLRLKKVYFD